MLYLVKIKMLSFLKEFLKNPLNIWAIAPSSRFLARKILNPISFDNDLLIVELWAGKWVFTKEILKRMSWKSRLYVFENNSNFIKDLQKIKDHRIVIINDCASNIWSHLHWQKADAVVSGLPFGSLCKTSDTIVNDILNAAKNNMKEWWIYTQFQYFLSNKKEINDVFGNYKIFFELRNIPPAFVYKAIKN